MQASIESTERQEGSQSEEKAVVGKQPYEPIVKLATLEQLTIGQAKHCIKGFY